MHHGCFPSSRLLLLKPAVKWKGGSLVFLYISITFASAIGEDRSYLHAWTSGPLQAPPACRCSATAVFVRCLCRLGLGTLAEDAPRHNEADPSKDVGSGVMCERWPSSKSCQQIEGLASWQSAWHHCDAMLFLSWQKDLRVLYDIQVKLYKCFVPVFLPFDTGSASTFRWKLDS